MFRKKFMKFLACTISVILLSTFFAACNDNKDNDGDNEDDKANIQGVRIKESFANLNTPKELFVIDGSRLSFDEYVLFQSLQGIVAQERSEIFIKQGDNVLWYKSLPEDYGITFTTVKDPYELFEKYKDKINDMGFVTFKQVLQANMNKDHRVTESLNNACTISGIEKYLVVSERLVNKMESLGFSKKADGTELSSFEIFQKYKDQLNNRLLMHQRPDKHQLRDFGIATKSLFFYNYTKDTEAQIEQIHDWLKPQSVVLGWNDDEVGNVLISSKHKNITVPTDYAINLSVYAGLPEKEMKQKPLDKRENGTNKHYAAFMITDGDNLTMHLGGMYTNKGFTEKQARTIPFGWTFLPLSYDFAPHIAAYYYRVMGGTDNFIASLSGAGYINPAHFPKDELIKFGKTTADYMKKMDMTTVAMLMDHAGEAELIRGEKPGVNTLQDIADAMSPYDQIKGGFFYYGDRYVPPITSAGGVTWSNGKPFINLRSATWFREGANRQKELVKLAYRINQRSKDATKIEGYSVSVISAFSNGYAELQTLASMLDEDVVIVSPSELVEIMAKNVKDKANRYKLTDPIDSAFHYESISDIQIVDYDTNYIKMKNIDKMTASDNTSYEFKDGLDPWSVVMVNKTGKAVAEIREVDINGVKTKVYYTSGSKDDPKDRDPDSYLVNKVKLPDKDNLKMKINARYDDCAVRVKFFVNDKIVIIQNYVIKDTGGKFEEWEIDISKYKGQTVGVIYETRDSNGIEGSKTSGTNEESYTARISFE